MGAGGQPGPPHPSWARPHLVARRGVVWLPQVAPHAVLSPIYSPLAENPKYPSIIPRKVPSPPASSTLAREGSEALPGTLPEEKIIAGGLYTTMLASVQMREQFILGLRVHSSS